MHHIELYASVGEDTNRGHISFPIKNKTTTTKRPDRLKSPDVTDKPTKLLKVEKRFMF